MMKINDDMTKSSQEVITNSHLLNNLIAINPYSFQCQCHPKKTTRKLFFPKQLHWNF